MLTEQSKTYKPFYYPWAIDLCREHESMHWVEDEADLGEDVNQWKTTLTDTEKNHIIQILRLFTQSDVAVGQVYYDKLIPVFLNNEVRNMLGSFACREAIHQRAYALLNDTLGLPDSDFSVFLEYQVMADKVDCMLDVEVDTPENVAKALAKAVFNEGVSLFASFVMLLNYQRYGKMRGMNTIVEWSLRDESAHVEGVAMLFHEWCKENPKIVTPELFGHIKTMAEKVVALEDAFIDLAYELGPIEGLTADEVKEYIRFIADRRLIQLGIKGIFNVRENPLPWLDWIINGADHSNFFEKRVTEYDLNGLGGDWGWE